MTCDICSNLFNYFTKLVHKLLCLHPSPANDKQREIKTEFQKTEEKVETRSRTNRPSVANVAAYGDVTMSNLPQPPYITPDVLGSEVDDYDSWNEEVEILEMESEAMSVTKGDNSNYTTAELDEAIFEDNPNRTESLGMSRQSEKDIDSIDEFFDNSGLSDGVKRYLDSTLGAEKEETPCTSGLPTEDEISQQADVHTDIRMMMNVSEPSSITTATVANIGSSDFDDSIDRSFCHVQEKYVSPREEKSNIPDDSLESFVRTLTQVTNDETQGKFSLCEEDAEREKEAKEEEEEDDDDRFTESQCTQTEEVSSSSNTRNASGRSKKRFWTKRWTKSLTHRFASDVGHGGAGKARVRSPPVGAAGRLPASFSLYAFLRNSCCRGARPTLVVAAPTNKKKRQRRPLQLDLAMGNLLKRKQWPTNSLINTTLCGSFRLVEQPKMGQRYDHRQSSAIAIPFLFGIQSTDVAPTKAGDSERTIPKEENTEVSENSESSKSSSKMAREAKPKDQK